MDAKKTGELIAKLRKEKGMSQKDLAQRLCVTNKAISRWETGRGYPDIETLPELSVVLGISVQELLDGEIVSKTEPIIYDRRSLETVCRYAGQQNRKLSRKVVFLSVAVVVILVILVFVQLVPVAADLYYSVIGSDRCVIASDYSSLTFYGEKYIPLPMHGYEGVQGERIIEEAQVEGADFLGKLLFCESLYEVKNVPDYEVVYLQTDYDLLESKYYVLETEFDRYAQLLNESEYDCYYASFDFTVEFPLDDEEVAAVTDSSAMQLLPESDGRPSVDIRVYELSHTFYRLCGHLRKSDDGFDWAPAEYHDEWWGYYMYHEYYRVGSEYNGLLDELFISLFE